MRLALIQSQQNALYSFLTPERRYTVAEAAALQREMLEQNLALMLEAAEKGCDLMVTTEAINFPGQPHKVQGEIAPLVDASVAWLAPRLSEIARKGRCYIAAAMFSRCAPGVTDGGLYNAIWLFDRQGDACAVYHKTHLAGDENDYLTPGDRYCVAETDFGKLGLAICWDMQFPETCQTLTDMGADLIVAPTWGWEWVYGPARAYENGVYVAAAMAVPEWGPIEGLRSPSEVIAPDGVCLARGSCTEAGVICCDIEDLSAFRALRDVRQQGRRRDLYKEKVMINIIVKDAQGNVLASASHDTEALLTVNREYQPGDMVEIAADDKHLWVQMDATILPGEVYLPEGHMTWVIPHGEHRLAYSPAAFTGGRHIVTARAMSAAERATRRNLACNPSDLRGDTDFFPHCTANVETRGESCFAARNVIDGVRHSDSHGEWPWQSWGIGAREDAWCLLDFGREVTVDEMALTLRADFPHDAYWVSGHVVLSDGAEVAYDLEKTGDRQFIPLGTHTVRWMRLERMQKSDDPSAFPALIEWEVFGAEA